MQRRGIGSVTFLKVEELPTIGTCASLKSVRLQRRSQVAHNYLCFHIYPCTVFVARCGATQFWLECQTISFFLLNFQLQILLS